MPFVNKIEARAYARATEILERVASSVQSVFPENLRQNLVMSKSKAEGQAGDAIVVITATLEGQENCEPVIDYVFEQMDSQSRRAIEHSLDIRLDDDCVFFLRIDKQAAFLGSMKIAGESDLISARFHFKQYPRCKREEVLLLIENRLRSAGGLA
ncbi:MAG: RNA-binding domain-containing protein [Candidatus Thorarchaeota archaeon]